MFSWCEWGIKLHTKINTLINFQSWVSVKDDLTLPSVIQNWGKQRTLPCL